MADTAFLVSHVKTAWACDFIRLLIKHLIEGMSAERLLRKVFFPNKKEIERDEGRNCPFCFWVALCEDMISGTAAATLRS